MLIYTSALRNLSQIVYSHVVIYKINNKTSRKSESSFIQPTSVFGVCMHAYTKHIKVVPVNASAANIDSIYRYFV